MQHQKQPEKYPKSNKRESGKQIHLPGWLWVSIGTVGFIVAGVVYLVVVCVGLFAFSRYLGATADPINFIVTNLLSSLIFAAVVIQAVVYVVQWLAMRNALKQGREGLQISERAYVGVRNITLVPTRSRDIAKKDMQNIVVGVENIGRLPADSIYVTVDVITLIPESIRAKYPNSLSGHYNYNWWWDFKSTKLFRGNINFEIPIPLDEKLDPIQWSQIGPGHARMIAQIRIDYVDGFEHPQRSDYAFRHDAGKWVPWWAWTSDEIERRIAEEIGRYPQYNT